MHPTADLPAQHFRTTHDSNLCPWCHKRNPVVVAQCRSCWATVLNPAHGAVALWALGEVDRGVMAELGRRAAHALGCPVVVQPGRLDPRPSERPAWQGRSGTVILNQMGKRQQPGCLANVAIVAEPVTSGAQDTELYGYAYMDGGAACISLQLLQEDQPDRATLVERMLSVCLHEIGHTLGLDDHRATDGIDCAMVGDVPTHRQFDPAAYPTKLCGACLVQARQRMQQFGAEVSQVMLPDAGALFGGRFELIEPAGEGGYGAVWRARDLNMNQEVALKFVRSEGYNGHAEVNLIAEAARARTLNHPNIVRVFDLVRDAGVGALVMDWIAGRDLESLRQERPTGVFDAEGLRDWAGQLCAAVQAAHDCGVNHQDIKPENCLIDARGVLHLADFGLARTSDHPQAAFLRGGTLPAGTPGFCAPEQMKGAAPWPAQDIYSIGATLYWLLTGQHARVPGDDGIPPWDARVEPVNTVRARLGPEAKVPLVPPSWESTIGACLDWNSVHRPSSVAEVARRLNAPPPPVAGGQAYDSTGALRGQAAASVPVDTAHEGTPPAKPAPADAASIGWWRQLRRYLGGDA
jgi:predicted Zn-dependent protease